MRVVVVGAGVLGASAAYHLARAGAETVVVDAGREGRATAAGAGIICPWASQVEDPDWYRLAAAGARDYPGLVARLAEEGEGDLGYARVGALVVSADPAALDRAEQRVLERRNAAPEAGAVSRLRPEEARALFPPLAPALAALHVAGAARIDGRRLATAMLRAASRRGATVRRGEATLRRAGDRVSGVVVDGETIAADVVLVAAGAWGDALLRPVGVALGIAPQRGQIVHLRMVDPDGRPAATAAWPVVLPQTSHYMLAFEDGRVVIGATRETGAGFDYRVTAAGQMAVLQAGLDVAPGLSGATLIETRIGFRPAGPGIVPVLHRSPGLLVGNGLGASGLTIGPNLGRLLAADALGAAPEIDLERYCR